MENIVKVLKETDKNIYISGHKKSDYDSLCSSFSLALTLQKLNKNVKVYVEEESIEKIKYFEIDELLTNEIEDEDYVFICVDLNKLARLPEICKNYFNNASFTINVDHHNGNSTKADYIYNDLNASSTCELIYNIIKKLDVSIDKNIAELLFVGIVSDTNCLANSMSSHTFTIINELTKKDIDTSFLIHKFYLEKTSQELRIIASMIENLKYDSFHYIVLNMRNHLYDEVSYVDISKNCIPTVFNNKDIKMLVVIMDYGNKKKGEIRTKGNINAERLASLLTGGGHTHAAGFSNRKSIEEIISISRDYIGSAESE